MLMTTSESQTKCKGDVINFQAVTWSRSLARLINEPTLQLRKASQSETSAPWEKPRPPRSLLARLPGENGSVAGSLGRGVPSDAGEETCALPF